MFLHPTILQSGIHMVVWEVSTVHTCSFMCANHIDVLAHPGFLRVGEHSGMVPFLTYVGTIPNGTQTPITEVSCTVDHD